MPEEGTPEYVELESNPDKAFPKTITVIEILARHSTDEVYLGQRDISEWTSDQEPLQAFEEFGNKLVKIEENILAMNKDPKLKNRKCWSSESTIHIAVSYK
ncbi:hypothetical protein Q3G72_031450 [Acer saccharum]|nr:hypothetical protein Q3G72_031450 [Acer saccharum]